VPTNDERPEVLRVYYRQMALIRAFELRAGEMYQRARIGGYCHLNLGEEATVVGLMAALEPRDYLFTTYREHGYALARGIDPGRVMAELFGKTTGVSGGWGGSMHLFDAKARLLGGYGIVGGQLPPATGAALALAHRGKPGSDADAVMCLLGDGTTNIGAFHESLNLAALWGLPIVYIIVNNRLGMGTPVERSSAEPDLYRRGCSYRIAGERVDGNDVLAVRDAARAALHRARVEQQPGLLEAQSYRLRGHSVVDPARYRSREDTERLRELDPLPAFRAGLMDAGVLDEDGAARIDADAEQQVSAAVEFAEKSPDPTPDQLFAHSYATPVPNSPRSLPGDPIVAGEVGSWR
jgi:pyruvate dehydrogenase E1 component alpha subunit